MVLNICQALTAYRPQVPPPVFPSIWRLHMYKSPNLLTVWKGRIRAAPRDKFLLDPWKVILMDLSSGLQDTVNDVYSPLEFLSTCESWVSLGPLPW